MFFFLFPALLFAKVAIIGCGLSGLSVNYNLKRNDVEIYEASKRCGGRVLSHKKNKDIIELGASFINSDHLYIQELAKKFGLKLKKIKHEGYIKEYIVLQNKKYSLKQINRNNKKVLEKLKIDQKRTDYGQSNYKDLDNLSVLSYLKKYGSSKNLISLVSTLYQSEYGMDLNILNALHLMELFSFEESVAIPDGNLGDESMRILEGNQKLVDGLLKKTPVYYQWKLEKVEKKEDGIQLLFLTPLGYKTKFFEKVILSISLENLKGLYIDKELWPVNKRNILKKSMGLNNKIILYFKRPLWKENSKDYFELVTDKFLLWDSSYSKDVASLTVYYGGSQSQFDPKYDIDFKVREVINSLSVLFPSLEKEYIKVHKGFHWPSNSLFKGSYSGGLKPGQWDISFKIEQDYNPLYFVGEHFSEKYAGFMEGALLSGKKCAQLINLPTK